MKRRVRQAFAIILLVFAVDMLVRESGVNTYDMPFFAGERGIVESAMQNPSVSSGIWEEITVSGTSVEDDGDTEPSTQISDADYEKYNEALLDGYAYGNLDNGLKVAYVQVYSTLAKFNDSIDMAVISVEDLNLVFQCVLTDHPEIFYCNGYSYKQYTRGDVVTRLTFSPAYTMTSEEADEFDALVEVEVSKIIAGISQDADDYTKVKYVYDYIIKNTDYDMSAPDNQNILSVLLNGKSVCQGYTKTAQLILNRLGIPTTLITGVVGDNQGHSWNMVMMDNEYYYMDATWGDASYQTPDGTDTSWLDRLNLVNYDYLGITTEEISKTHIIDNPVYVPICTATRNNYYVREGLLLTDYDESQIRRVFDSHVVSENEALTIKCQTQGIYSWLVEYLISDSKIFDYLPNARNGIGYALNDDAYSLTLWLDV